MKIEFLQSYEDALQFVDFLYDNLLYISWNNSVVERGRAKELLRACLISHTGGNYCIGNDTTPDILALHPCSQTSHPRYVHRNGRYAGWICEYASPHDKQLSNEVVKRIKTYFTKKYTFLKVNPSARFCAYFGPHYLCQEEDYVAEKLPSHICFGYILLTSSVAQAFRVWQKLEDFANSQTILKTRDLWQGYAYEGAVQHYMTFLFDRSTFTFAQIKEIAEKLNFEGHKLRVINETLYDDIFSLPPFSLNFGAEWQTKIAVEREWKGFGNF